MQRITNQMQMNDLIYTLNERMRNLNDLQNQISTGKRVYYASDDPAAAGMILRLRNSLNQNEQYQENLQDGKSWMINTEESLQSMYEMLTEARADAVEGSNEAITPEGMAMLAEEINGYLENFYSLSNSDYGGKTIFGGTNTTETAFNAIRDPITGNITSVTSNANGIDGSIMRQIDTGEQIQININGAELFQPNGVSGDEDIFQTLINLRDALNGGDIQTVGDIIPQIDDIMANVSDMTTLIGSRVTRLNNLEMSLLAEKTTLTGQLSQQEDTDLVEAITNMTLEQNAYQVALNVGGMIIQPSLAQFIG
ncbi:flagellar hook-associated protein FlgL [bacterium]|nr:flagellar hook-associated protein FlgL [bacterium]MBU1651416.1 flagellar hook-associated protein FlgL [bacterium]